MGMKQPIPLGDLPVLDVDYKTEPTVEGFAEGFVIPIDKPSGWSSFAVVKYVRNRIPVRKVGHAGTLDPLATGLLILCCGRATKSISQIQELPKTYIAEITFGASTPSYDSATEFDNTSSWDHITKEQVENVLKSKFIGTIRQVPPVYSALRKDGKRLYQYARKGEDVKPDPRFIQIHSIEILKFKMPKIQLKVNCGKGTYIRSLAHDLGLACESLAYMSGLRRTETGSFHVDKAWNPEHFDKWSKSYGNDETA